MSGVLHLPLVRMRFEIHLQKMKFGRSTHMRYSISGRKEIAKGTFSTNAIAVFVDNRRLMVATRLILTCSGNLCGQLLGVVIGRVPADLVRDGLGVRA